MQPGESPSVVAMSWGQGNPQKDVVTVVYMDEAGRLREHTKLDNLHDQENKDEFHVLQWRKWSHVIAAGGQSIATGTLSKRPGELLNPPVSHPTKHKIELCLHPYFCGVMVRVGRTWTWPLVQAVCSFDTRWAVHCNSNLEQTYKGAHEP